jgi:hypothetical protein
MDISDFNLQKKGCVIYSNTNKMLPEYYRNYILLFKNY